MIRHNLPPLEESDLVEMYKFWIANRDYYKEVRRKVRAVDRIIKKYGVQLVSSDELKELVNKKYVTRKKYPAFYSRANTMNNRAIKFGDKSTLSEKDLIEIMGKGGGRCKLCNSTDSLVFDHIVPYYRGGMNVKGNIQVLCRKCNMEKGVT